MQWQPIETAPKDGGRVLVWIDDLSYKGPAFASLWFFSTDGRLGGGAEGYNGDWNITHWMPLPNPPEQDQRGDDTTTCRWWRDEYGNWCCACSDTMPDFTPWPSADPNGAHCPKCGKTIATKVHDKP